MSTYATTYELDLGEQSTTVAINRNLIDTVDGDAVRLDVEGRHGSAYLTRKEAVALAFAILEAAGEQPVGRFCQHDERGSHPGDTSSAWTRNGLTFPNLRPVCPSARPVYAAPTS